MNLLWIDIETGGLNPIIHSIVDICLVETNADGDEVWRYETKITPNPELVITNEAAIINGYDPKLWTDAASESQAAMSIWNKIYNKKLRPAGWCVGFDVSFLKALLERALSIPRPARPKLDHHVLDLFSLSFALWERHSHLPDNEPSLRGLLKHLGICDDPFKLHTASGDVNACLTCYRAMLKPITVPTRALRLDDGKLRYDLIPREWEEELAKILTLGASKYADDNWKASIGKPESEMWRRRCLASLRRHLAAWQGGEHKDGELKTTRHLAHVAWNALAIMTYDIGEGK